MEILRNFAVCYEFLSGTFLKSDFNQYLSPF